MRNIILIILFYIGASVLTEAFSASILWDSLTPDQTDIYGKIIKERNEEQLESKSILDSLSFPELSKRLPKPDKTESILNTIIGSVNKKEKGRRSSTSALDYLIMAYSRHSYYQSGKWEEAEDWSTITRDITLPEYDPAEFVCPASGYITSRFGFRSLFGRIHKGVDIALNIGDTIRAALPGVVAKISYDSGGYGHYVILVHNNGLETRYAHLDTTLNNITVGHFLNAGDPLGFGGSSGNSTGPHLHFEIRLQNEAVDPTILFNFNKRKK